MIKVNPLELSPTQQCLADKARRKLDFHGWLSQLLHPILWANWAPEPSDVILKRIPPGGWGGAFMGTGSSGEMRKLISAAQKRVAVPMVIAGDHECGCRAIEATPFGSAMNFGAIQPLEESARLLYEASAVTAREARSYGCNWSFSPVVDLNFNRENPITNHRSYGTDPERVAALSVAAIRGMQENGIAATAKHFPGDGIDSRDQHLLTTVNTLSPEHWRRTYGRTFGAAFDAGVMAVMTGWLAWLPRSRRDSRTGLLLPAAVDPRIQIDLLREEMGFQGLVITDALGMGGLWALYPNEAVCGVEALKAGADMLLFVKNVPAMIEEMERALDDGRLTEKRIEESVVRVLAMKARLGLLDDAPPVLDDTPAPAVDLSREVAERSLTLVCDWDGLYPLKQPSGSKIVLFDLPVNAPSSTGIGVGEDRDAVAARDCLSKELTAAGYRVVCVTGKEVASRELADASTIIYMMFACPSAGRGSLRMSPEALESIDWERIRSGFPAYFVSFGNPYAIQELAALPNYVCAYSRQSNIITAYAQALLGRIPFQGVCPVDIERVTWGFESDRFGSGELVNQI